MKKVGIITFQRADNYGAMLQLLALYKYCEMQNVDVSVIDYRCHAIENVYPEIRMPGLSRNVKLWLKRFSEFILYGKKQKIKTQKYKEFRNRFKMSVSVSTEKDKDIIEKQYDLIITGSDQIWNNFITQEKDSFWYCYKKLNRLTKTASYAASAGSVENLKRVYDIFGPIINSYDAISIREHDLCDWLKDEGQLSVTQVLDPTLLLSSREWDNYIGNEFRASEPYILYYDVQSNQTSIKAVKALSEEKKMKVYVLGTTKKLIDNSELMVDAGPEDFVQLIKNANYIVTSSFHAVAFSIIYKKFFICSLHSKTGSRIEMMLKELGLEGRILISFPENISAFADKEIDYDSVYSILMQLRKKSCDFIKKMMQL